MNYALLNAREKTDAFEKKLLRQFDGKTLVTIRANIPGIKKGCLESNYIVYKIFLECKKKLKPAAVFHSYTDEEGLIFFLIVKSDPVKTKRATVKIEETHLLGRLSDIDVATSEKIISRADVFGKNSTRIFRTCFLCGQPAKYCSRNRAHSFDDLMRFINGTVYSYWRCGKASGTPAALTDAALLGELCRPLGFGCVTANGTGAHSDMDFLLMLKCIPLISRTIKKMKKKHCADFTALRKYGAKIEKQLFKLTNGVNTYKGALFLLLILNACILRLAETGKPFEHLSAEIAEFSKPVGSDFALKKCSKASLSLFSDTAQQGIRGEVLSGFAEHFDTWLPMLKNGTDINGIIVHMLSRTWDSTVIKRKGLAALKELQKEADGVLRLYEKNDCTAENETPFFRAAKALSDRCITENTSTGGTADKIIILYALFLLEKFWKRL